MTPFDRLDCIASRAVDRLNAEPAMLRPKLSRPNGPAAIDPDRPSATARVVFSQRPTPIAIQVGDRRAGSQANDMRMLASGTAIEVSVDRTVYPNFATARTGDHLEARGRRFSVVSVAPDGQARIVFQLTEINQ